MSDHVILGDGVAGRHHQRVLSDAGRRIVAVLDARDAGFASQWEKALHGAPARAIWHVCTPSETHISYLAEILAARPGAGVIIEKPIGRPAQGLSYARLARTAPVMMQSQYSYARVVEPMARLAASWRKDGPLRASVRFAKQRTGGSRFVDADRGPLGYEVFHQIALGYRLLGAVSEAAPWPERIMFRVERARIAATQCQILLTAGRDRLEVMSDLDSPHRYATVSVDGAAGTARLGFETNAWFTGSPRQTHLVSLPMADMVLEEDLMSTGVLACVDAVERRDWRRIAENRRLAVRIDTLLDAALLRAQGDADQRRACASSGSCSR